MSITFVHRWWSGGESSMLAATYSYPACVLLDLQSRSESSHRIRCEATSPHPRSQDNDSSIDLDYSTSYYIFETEENRSRTPTGQCNLPLWRPIRPLIDNWLMQTELNYEQDVPLSKWSLSIYFWDPKAAILVFSNKSFFRLFDWNFTHKFYTFGTSVWQP